MPNLDSFTILFNSDSLKEFEQELKKSEQSLDNAEKQVKKLEQELAKLEEAENKDTKAIAKTKAALEEARNTAENFKKTVANMKQSNSASLLELRNNFIKLSKAVGALAFVGLAIRKSLNFYEQGEQLEFLAEKTGIAVEKLQQLGNAAKRYGGTTEGTAGTIENLRQQYQDARIGNASGGVKQAYLKYGFTLSQDPEKTLERLAAKMETLKSDTAKWDLAKNLGIDEGTTRLLIQGQQRYNEELKKANKYKLYTKEDIQRMRDYRQISQDIRMGIESIFASISRALLPAITIVAKVIRSITDWLSAHSGAVKIAGVFLIITAAVTSLIGIIYALNKAFLFLSANPVILTITAIIAVITLLIAAIQDFIVFLQGGDSIIGDILKKMGFNVNKVRQNCLNFFNNIKDWIFKTVDWLKSLGGKFAELGDKIKELWNSIPAPLRKLISLANPIEFSKTVKMGKEIIKQYNENKLNSVPQGAITTYNQTQSINNNNNNNAKTTNNSIKRSVEYNGITINIKSDNPEEVTKQLQAAFTAIDNGQLA